MSKEITTSIDWNRCTHNLITHDNPDLPSNIRAIQADELNNATLRKAFSLMKNEGASIIQIETPQTQGLIGFPHQYISHYGRFSIDVPLYQINDHMRPTSYSEINESISNEFEKMKSEVKTEHHKMMVSEWQNQITSMTNAAKNVFPTGFKGLWVYGNGQFDQNNKQSLHTHDRLTHPKTNKELAGYYLNFTPSHDGTMFAGADGNLWYGKAGCFNLFTSEGHPNIEAAEHDVPGKFKSPIENEHRATAVLQIYPL